jgi:hypothetical protein
MSSRTIQIEGEQSKLHFIFEQPLKKCQLVVTIDILMGLKKCSPRHVDNHRLKK